MATWLDVVVLVRTVGPFGEGIMALRLIWLSSVGFLCCCMAKETVRFRRLSLKLNCVWSLVRVLFVVYVVWVGRLLLRMGMVLISLILCRWFMICRRCRVLLMCRRLLLLMAVRGSRFRLSRRSVI